MKDLNIVRNWLSNLMPEENHCLECAFESTGPTLGFLRHFAQSENINLQHLFEVRLTEKVREMGVDPRELAEAMKEGLALEYREDRLAITGCISPRTLYRELEKFCASKTTTTS